MLEVGYPRNDVLLKAEGEEIRARTRAALGIGRHQKAVLYAPTFRDYLSNDGMTAKGVRFFDPKAAAEALGPSYVVLVRGHAFNARAGLRRVEGDRVVDVTYYPDVTDLCLASDAAILDYSSLRFDYALLRRPMVFLVPDEEEYHANRPAIMPFRPTAPGPRVSDDRRGGAGTAGPARAPPQERRADREVRVDLPAVRGRPCRRARRRAGVPAVTSSLLLPEGACLVHIGPYKTGSSSIQAAFHAKRAELREQHGVVYPGKEVRARRAGWGVIGVTPRGGGPPRSPRGRRWSTRCGQPRTSGSA